MQLMTIVYLEISSDRLLCC